MEQHQFSNVIIENYSEENSQIRPILFTCEHATNELPPGYEWSESDLKYFKNEHWGWDPGQALKMAKFLAQNLKGILVYSRYSRLFVDVNRPIISKYLIRTHGDGHEIDLNKNLDLNEEEKRISFHTTYLFTISQPIYISIYKFKEQIVAKYQPDYVFSIHSFNPVYEGKVRQLEIGILYNYCDEFNIKMNQLIVDRGYLCQLNEPYSGKKGTTPVLDNCLYFNFDKCTLGTGFEFRNDLLQNEELFQKLSRMILEVIKINLGL